MLSVVASLPTQANLTLPRGLHLRLWEPVLGLTALYCAVTFRRYRWALGSPSLLLIPLSALVLLVRSLWQLHLGSAYVPPLVDVPGDFVWPGGQTAPQGVSEAILLVGYSLLALVAGLMVGRRVTATVAIPQAVRVLVLGLAVFAALFVGTVAVSFIRFGFTTAHWLVLVRGISLVHDPTYPLLLQIGPLEGVSFATGSVVASSWAVVESRLRALMAVSAGILAVAALISLARGGWLVLVVGWILTLLLLNVVRRRVLLTGLIGLVLVALVVVVGIVVSGHASSPILERLVSVFSSTGGARLQQYGAMLNGTLANPIFGNGVDAYRSITHGLPAEDWWLEVAFSGGLLATIPLLIAHIEDARLFLRLPKAVRTNEYTWATPIFLGFVGVIVGALTNTSGLSPLYWIVLGITLGCWNPLASRDSTPAESTSEFVQDSFVSAGGHASPRLVR